MLMDNGEEYLSMYPVLRKWINECVNCHTKGYNPNILEIIYPFPSKAEQNLRCYFKPLELSKEGLCNNCTRKLLKLNQYK